MQAESIFLPGKARWKGYENIRDRILPVYYSDILENMWSVYKSYADNHFRKELKESEEKFNQRIWEMILGYTLLIAGHTLISTKKGKRPDIGLNRVHSENIWIENVCPTKGHEKLNSVPDLVHAPIIDPDTGYKFGKLASWISSDVDRQIKLRYLSSFRDKSIQISKYINDKIIKPNEPVLIAINSANFAEYEPINDEIPLAIGLCYGLGNQEIQIKFEPNSNSREIYDKNYIPEWEIKKRKSQSISENISAGIFCTKAFSHIKCYFRTLICQATHKVI